MIYRLMAYSTDRRTEDIRYLDYTTSKKKADKFRAIPKIQFTDSGHGIVFVVSEHKGKRRKVNHWLSEQVNKYLKG